MSDRALANNILLYFATLVMTVLLWVTLNGPFNDLMGHVNCSTSACSTGSTWVTQLWDNAMWLVLVVGILLLVSAAIFESRRPV